MLRIATRHLLLLGLLLFVGSCDQLDDLLNPTGGSNLTPTDITLVDGGDQTGEVARELGDLVVVEVVDASGTPVPRVAVAWSADSDDNASVSPASDSTDIRGRAQAVWILGETAGEQGLTVSLPDESGVSALTVSATAEPGPAAALDPSPDTLRFDAIEASDSVGTAAADQFGNTITSYTVDWSSDDPSIAMVEATGHVTAMAAGTTAVHGAVDAAGTQVTVIVDQVPTALEIGGDSTLSAIADTARLEAALADANGYPIEGKTVSWTSLDTATATVSATGLLTARAVGSAEVVAAIGSLADTTTAVVSQQAAEVVVSPERDTAEVGGTATFTAEAFDGNGNAIASPSFTWSSLNSNRASVSANGLATALAPGNARIRVAMSGAADTAVLHIPAPQVAYVVVTPETVDLEAVGDTASLTAAAFDADSTELEHASLFWSTSDAAIAKMDGSGRVTAQGEGTTWVRATSGGQSDSARVRVGVATLPDSIDVTPDSLHFSALGDADTASALVYNLDREEIAAEVVWTVQDTLVAAVDTAGAVTSVGPGITSLIGTAESVADTVPVVVAQEMVAVVASPASDSVVLDGTARFTAEAVDANAYPIDTATIAWSSLDTAIATVDTTGAATGKSGGTVGIVATSGTLADTATLVVLNITVDSVVVTPSEDSLFFPGDTTRLTAAAYDQTGTLITVDVAYQWSSSDPAIASVDGAGLVTADNGGEAWVYGTAGTASDSARIVVALNVDSVAISPDSLHFTFIAQEIPVSAELRDASGNVIVQRVAWSVVDTTVAALSGDTVVAWSQGVTSLVATSGGTADTVPVVVEPDVDSIRVLPDTLTLGGVGILDTLAAEAYDNAGQLLTGKSFTWSTADSAIAVVDTAGVVGSRGLGATWIHAAADAGLDSARVVVTQIPSDVVVIFGNGQSGDASVQLPDSLVVEVRDASGAPIDSARVVWTTSDGSLSPDTTFTNPSGRTWSWWTMPNDAGTFNATATAADSVFAEFSATVSTLPGDPACSEAGTSHTAGMNADETWTATGSPHHVSSDFLIAGTATLTIEPGALLCFGSGAELQTSEQGSIDARGTSTDSILMVAANVAEPWDGLGFATNASNDTSWLSNVRISDVGYRPIDAQGPYTILADSLNIQSSGAVVLDGDDSRLTATTIEETHDAVAIQTVGDRILLQDVDILNAGSRGIHVVGDSLRIENVWVDNAGTEGIWSFSSVRGVVIDGFRVTNPGGTGLVIPPAVVDSAAGVRVEGGASYPAEIGIDILSLLAPTAADQDSLLGNAKDTLVISSGTLYFDTVTAGPRLPWRVKTLTSADTSSVVRVLPGARLAFEPFADLAFDNGASLDAQGTADSIIVFTAVDPSSNPWYGLDFYGASFAPATSTIRHALIEYTAHNALYAGPEHTLVVEDTRIRQGGGIEINEGGSALRRVVVDTASEHTGNDDAVEIFTADSTVVEDLTIRGSASDGLYVYNSLGTVLRRVTIEGSARMGLYLGGSEGVTLDTVTIADNDSTGIYAESGTIESSTGLRVSGNGGYPASLAIDALVKIAPTAADQDSLLGNTKDTLEIRGGVLYYDTAFARPDLPWRVTDWVYVDTLSQLVVLPGTHVAMDPFERVQFEDGGSLDAQGTADSVITFTSSDTPTLSQPVPDNWYGFDFYGASFAPVTSTIRHALFEYTDASALDARTYHTLVVEDTRIRQGGGIQVDQGGSEIRRVVVDTAFQISSTSDAIFVDDADSTVIEDVTVRASGGDGIRVDDSPGTVLRRVLIDGSGRFGLELTGFGTEPVTLEDVEVANSDSTGITANAGMVGTATGVRVHGSGAYGAEISLDALAKIAPTVADQDSLLGNAKDTLVLNGGEIYYDTVYARPDLPWRIDNTIYVDTLSQLVVLPGTHVAVDPFNSIRFDDGGSLDAQGTADSVITFTSSDTPTVSEPVPDNWYGFDFYGASFAPVTSTIRHALIEYTDASGLDARTYHTLVMEDSRIRQGGAIQVDQAGSEIRRVVVDTAFRVSSSSDAIYVDDADSTVVEDVTVRASGGDGIRVDDSPGVVLRRVLIDGSARYGLELTGFGTEPVTLEDVEIANSGSTGITADPGTVGSATGVRVHGSGAYGAEISLDALARIAPTVADQDSLLGNAKDTLVIDGGSIYFDTVYARPDLPWRIDNSIYADTLSVVNVLPGTHVAVDPFNFIRFDNGARLDAQGTADSVITFTSSDTPTLSQPEPDNWYGIDFYGLSTLPVTSTVRHALVEYTDGSGLDARTYHTLVIEDSRIRQGGAIQVDQAGSEIRRVVVDTAFRVSTFSDAIYVNDADSTVVEDVTVRASGGDGIRVDNGPGVVLRRVLIDGSARYGLELTGSDGVTLEDVEIADNGDTGIWAAPGTVESSTGLRVQGNGGYGVEIGLEALVKIAPTAADQDSLLGNAKDTLVIQGGTLYYDTAFARPDLPWRVSNYIYVDTLSLLKVLPGTRMAFNPFNGMQFEHGGKLDARGKPDSLIVFTSSDQPTVSSPTPDPWYGPLFYGRTRADTSYISNAIIEYTTNRALSVETSGNATHVVGIDSTHFRHGSTIRIRSNGSWMRYSVVDSSSVGTTGDAVYLLTQSDTTTGTTITFYGNVVRGSSGYGVGGYNPYGYTAVNISYSEITGSGNDGVYVGPINTLTQCNIYGNGGVGLEYWSSGTLVAENNWWGDADGPTGTNGDGVASSSGTVDYDPWLGSAVTIPDNPWVP